MRYILGQEYFPTIVCKSWAYSTTETELGVRLVPNNVSLFSHFYSRKYVCTQQSLAYTVRSIVYSWHLISDLLQFFEYFYDQCFKDIASVCCSGLISVVVVE